MTTDTTTIDWNPVAETITVCRADELPQGEMRLVEADGIGCLRNGGVDEQ